MNETSDGNESWLMEYFKDVKFYTPEEKAEHKRVADEVAKTMMGDEACRQQCNEILKPQNVCPRCMGSGYVDYRNAGGICFKCNGVGFLPKK